MSSALASLRNWLSLSMSIPISVSSALNSSKASLPRERSTMAMWAGSTALSERPSALTLNLASSTSVDTTFTTSFKTSALAFAWNISPPSVPTCNPMAF